MADPSAPFDKLPSVVSPYRRLISEQRAQDPEAYAASVEQGYAYVKKQIKKNHASEEKKRSQQGTKVTEASHTPNPDEAYYADVSYDDGDASDEGDGEPRLITRRAVKQKSPQRVLLSIDPSHNNDDSDKKSLVTTRWTVNNVERHCVENAEKPLSVTAFTPVNRKLRRVTGRDGTTSALPLALEASTSDSASSAPVTRLTKLRRRRQSEEFYIPNNATAVDDGKPQPFQASMLAPAKRKWKKAVEPAKKTPMITNATLEPPRGGQVYHSSRSPEATHGSDSRMIPRDLPAWYPSVNATHVRYRRYSPSIQVCVRLYNVFCQDLKRGVQNNDALVRLRDQLHKTGLFNFEGHEKEAIRNSHILTDGTLDAIRDNRLLPNDIRNLARSLKDRWWQGDTSPDLMRGTSKSYSKTKDGKGRVVHNLDMDYSFKISANFVGEGHLINGQWWPLLICAVRDGAHGDLEAGIHGHKAEGAFSINVSGGGYANIDNGDILEYCGTTGAKDQPSYGTILLLTSMKKEQSVRVLRSAKAKSKYSPKHGLRYDGLYKVKGFKIIDVDVALHRFAMEREPGQMPIRFEGSAKRPHQAEIDALMKDKALKTLASA